MPALPRWRPAVATPMLFLLLSTSVHLGVVGALRVSVGAPRARATIPPVDGASGHASVDVSFSLVPAGAAWPRTGGQRRPGNLDSRRAGRGSGGAQNPSILLADVADNVTLRDSTTNASVSQLQRLRTHRSRQSWENRRATPNPGETAFLASGMGRIQERRPQARQSARGVADQTSPSEASEARRGLRPSGTGAMPQQSTGAATSAPQQGTHRGNLDRPQRSAAIAHGRPPVDQGSAATLARTQGRPADNVDSEHLAAQLVQSLVDSTTAQGTEGAGNGAGANGAGSGQRSGDGSRGSPFQSGQGPHPGANPYGPQYRRWYLTQRRQVEAGLRYPRERLRNLDQGISVFRLRVRRDGSLAAPPRLLRSSGFPDLDRAARQAIASALPFAPMPENVAPGRSELRVDMNIEFSNPMIR